MHCNALHDLHIPANENTHIWHDVSRRAFSGIRTDPTRARKIVRQRFVPWTRHNELCDPQILPDVKHNFSVTCPDGLFVESLPVRHEHEK
jgi:hypothetical protein